MGNNSTKNRGGESMNEKLRKATHQGILPIGDVEIPCFVLEDGTRVISGRGMTKAIGMKGRGQGVARILVHPTLKAFINNELSLAIENPIEFKGGGPKPTNGYEATILHDLCQSVLKARDAGVLKTEQEKRYAHYCDILVRAFARIGIVALVDEATGYQEIRDKIALQKILELYIAKELRPWIKTFPDEFYENLFRLRGWQFRPLSVKRPIVVGKITNDLIYRRLAPKILEELKTRTPRDEKGRTKHRYFQWLTDDIGHPKLREHLASVTTLMKASANWTKFYRLIQRALPQYGQTLELPLTDREIEKMKTKEEDQLEKQS